MDQFEWLGSDRGLFRPALTPELFGRIKERFELRGIAAGARGFAGAVVNHLALAIDDGDGRDEAAIIFRDERLLRWRRIVDVDDDEIDLVAILRIKRHQPFRFAIGIPAMRGAEEHYSGAIAGNGGIADGVSRDRKVGAGIIGKGEIWREVQIAGRMGKSCGNRDSQERQWSDRFGERFKVHLRHPLMY